MDKKPENAFNPKTEVERSAGFQTGLTSVFGFNRGPVQNGAALSAKAPHRQHSANLSRLRMQGF